MNKEKEDFFLHSNEVNHINREDYDKIELLVNAAKAFARSYINHSFLTTYKLPDKRAGQIQFVRVLKIEAIPASAITTKYSFRTRQTH